jgi:thiamine biosynthesis lipoprotein
MTGTATISAPGHPGVTPEADPTPVRHASAAMGGRLVLRVVARPGGEADAGRGLQAVAGRVRAWASILTRHADDSALLRLNRDPRPEVPVGPTLAAVLAWATDAALATGGIVDAALLDERLAAQGLAADGGAGATAPAPHGRHPLDGPAPRPAWSVRRGPLHGPHGASTVIRAPGTRIDLDGVAKGWIADRALGLLAGHPGAIVDADGDIAIRPAPGEIVDVGVGDPRSVGDQIAVLSLAAGPDRRTWGVATSGVSVHRWAIPGGEAHHLIDPRTRRPAATDVVQATVVAGTAREAEAFAKAAVILGSVDGLGLLDRSGVAGAILLLRDDRVVALPRTMELVA